MIFKKYTITTEGFCALKNITAEVEEFLHNNDFQNGWVNIFTQHTTTAIKINEDEAGFHKDLKRIVFDKIAPPSEHYVHNDLEVRDPKTLCPLGGEECANGHSHVAQMFLGSASETIPVKDGKMLLGRWQQILFIELDHARERTVIFSFMGES